MRVAHSLLVTSLLAAAGGFVAAAQAAATISVPAKVCDVTRYGANGARQQIVLNTEYFQHAIDDCASAGGGTVNVPAGNYLVAPLFLKSNIRLHLDKNATLVASTEEASYRATSQTQHAEAENGWLPFLSVAGASNVEISGEGTIDGQGAVWWERWRAHLRANPAKRGATDRPRLIYIKGSQNVRVEGLNLFNSPSFHVVVRDSDNVDVTRNRIITPWHAPNTDGVDPIDSRNVRITYNYIDCNDDHVAIKAEKFDPKYPDGVVSNIYVAHNTLMQGRGISIGSESSGGVRHVDTDPAQPFDPLKTPHFSNVTVKNLVSTGKTTAAAYVVGVPEAPMTGLVFENVSIDADQGMLVRHAEITGKKLRIRARSGEVLILQKGSQVMR